MIIQRGDIYYADLRPVVGSEQGGIRPVLIIQNDVGNRHSPTVICAAITSQMHKAKLCKKSYVWGRFLFNITDGIRYRQGYLLGTLLSLAESYKNAFYVKKVL